MRLDSTAAAIKIDAVRKAVRKSERESPWAITTYACEVCGMQQKVLMCRGVELFDVPGQVPAPEQIVCSMCDENAIAQGDLEFWTGASFDHLPFLRIPSRRAARAMVREGIFEAQLVRPQ